MKKILSIICCALFLYACETSSGGGDGGGIGENVSQGGDVSGAGNIPSQDENTPTINPDKPGETITPPVVNPPVEEKPISIDKKYWGRWLWLDNPGKEEILDKNTKSDACKVYDDNLLECKITTYKKDYYGNTSTETTQKYLVRAGSSSQTVRGYVSKLGVSAGTPSARYSGKERIGGAGFGSLNAALSISRTDKDGNKTEYGKTETKEDGSFEFPDVPSGDYVVNIEDSTLSGSANVSINNSDADVGIITAVKESDFNFKSEVIFEKSENNTGKFLFANRTVYTGKIRITNTGKTEAESITYDFKIDDPTVYQFTDETALHLGTLLVGAYKDIKFTVAFDYIDDPKKTIKMDITVKDSYGQEWHDYVSFDIFGRYSFFKLESEKSLTGFLTIPGQKMLAISGTSILEKIPYLHDKTYDLTFVNSIIQNETKYAFGIDSNDPLDYSNFKDTKAHEPNDTTETATNVDYSKHIVSYMARRGFGVRERQDGDIDRFKIIMNSTDPVQQTAKINFYKHGTFCDLDYIGESGNGWNNGKLNSGEIVYFQIAVVNSGNKKAEGVSVSMKLVDPYISLIMPPNVRSYDIDDGYAVDSSGTKENDSYNFLLYGFRYKNACDIKNETYKMVISKNTPANYKANIKVIATDKYANIWTDYMPIVVNPQ